MPALIIPSQTTFGAMTNSVVSRLAGLNTTVQRLAEAVENATTGFAGTPGTEFEATLPGTAPTGYAMMGTTTNNFGVQPDPAAPGANGVAYAAAVQGLNTQWVAFWTLAAPFIKAIDNGQAATTM